MLEIVFTIVVGLFRQNFFSSKFKSKSISTWETLHSVVILRYLLFWSLPWDRKTVQSWHPLHLGVKLFNPTGSRRTSAPQPIHFPALLEDTRARCTQAHNANEPTASTPAQSGINSYANFVDQSDGGVFNLLLFRDSAWLQKMNYLSRGCVFSHLRQAGDIRCIVPMRLLCLSVFCSVTFCFTDLRNELSILKQSETRASLIGFYTILVASNPTKFAHFDTAIAFLSLIAAHWTVLAVLRVYHVTGRTGRLGRLDVEDPAKVFDRQLQWSQNAPHPNCGPNHSSRSGAQLLKFRRIQTFNWATALPQKSLSTNSEFPPFPTTTAHQSQHRIQHYDSHFPLSKLLQVYLICFRLWLLSKS